MKRAERVAVKRDIRRRKAYSQHHPPREKDSMDINETTRVTTEHHEIQIKFPGEGEGWHLAERVEPALAEASLATWRGGNITPGVEFRLVKITTWTETETEVLG